ncbi:T9SS type A sorting domain-containing protein [Cryomorpha ignava]|uniref:T9SS type A sorting domain-containing protein n=1 Tax=Cryomorpha ignava TaxID=101383 RepID=A0A7K3WQ05_9FLAO|nr:T9SS type A sorting domain-containing protein [Cryomorpha ignava]NEN22845.1 T9SS type A sorting domain-containing protein [Cryomorpha ignava]
MIIETGATVTITGTLKMSPGRKIIVRQNATLIVDGGTITNSDCRNTFWHGIEVAGNTDEHQYSISGGNYHQGRLILKNGAIIENARNGARNMLGNDWNARGGIIQATNSSFINCRRAVEFMSYQNFSPSNSSINRPDQSYFNECLFELNDNYLVDQDEEPPAARITLWKTDRVRISGCQFINTSTVSETEHRSIGVYSHDANYSITERCLDIPQQIGVCNNEVPSIFRGWYKAVEALETTSGRPIIVRKSTFEENMIGVEINGASFSEIYQNDFLVGNHPFPEFAGVAEDTKNHLAIHVIETTHYGVEENDIEKPSGATYDGNGVLVYNSLGAENAIYKNQFSDLQTGAESDRVNRNSNYTGGVPAGLGGLQFLCNLNSGNDVDFRISRNDPIDQQSFEYLNAGTRQDHGSDQPDRPANNTFTSPDADPSTYTHFTVDSYFAFKYFYDSNPPSTSEITPGTFVAPILVSNAQGCPSNYTTGKEVLPTPYIFRESQDEFNGLMFAYQEIIDDGNTPAMITQIDLTWPSQAWDLRNSLMARAPYNSEQVLIAAALREIMPHAMLLEVLLANPDALGSGNVIRVVSTQLGIPLPQYMVDMLYAARDQTTLRTIMERTLADLNFERQRNYKRLVNSKYFLDDQVDEPDSVIYYLSRINTLESNIARAAAYSDRSQFSLATALLDSMIVYFKLDQAQTDELSTLKSLYSLIGTAETQGRNIAQLNSSEIASLITIGDNNDAGLAQSKAQNALCFHYNICVVPEGTPKNNRVSKHKTTKEELADQLNTATAYPNPATDFVTVEFQLLLARENTRLAVFDPLGREVESRILGMKYKGQELFDTRNWSDGLYIFTILQNDELVETGKFTIVR